MGWVHEHLSCQVACTRWEQLASSTPEEPPARGAGGSFQSSACSSLCSRGLHGTRLFAVAILHGTTSPWFVECVWHVFFSENFTDPYFTWWTDLTAWHIQPVRWLDTSSDLGCLKIAKIGYPRTIMVQYFIFFPSQNCHANWAHNSIHFFETISSSPYSWLFIVYISLYPIMPCLHDGCLKPNSLSWATHDTHGKSPHCSWHIGISPFYHHRSSARMRKWLQWPPWKTLQHLPSSLVPRCQGDGLKAMAPSGKS